MGAQGAKKGALHLNAPDREKVQKVHPLRGGAPFAPLLHQGGE
jgi:hypothetical protein